MKHRFARRKIFAVICTATALANCARAATIFESGTLGETGIPEGSVDATNVNANVYTGVRFELTEPVLTTEVGGHFVDRSGGTFFGVIVQLDGADDFPDSGNLMSNDVLGATELTFPVPSAEVFGDLELSLGPGWYALVFGSGLFGTNGDGAAPLNNPDIGDPIYIGWQPGDGWLNLPTLSTIFRDQRFVVLGSIVPEPTSGSMLFLLAVLLPSFIRKRNHRG